MGVHRHLSFPDFVTLANANVLQLLSNAAWPPPAGLILSRSSDLGEAASCVEATETACPLFLTTCKRTQTPHVHQQQVWSTKAEATNVLFQVVLKKKAASTERRPCLFYVTALTLCSLPRTVQKNATMKITDKTTFADDHLKEPPTDHAH